MTASYYACAIQHDDRFVAKFGLPGKAPEFIMDHQNRPMLFPSAEIAELNAWRHVGARLNGARSPQIFVPRRIVKRTTALSEAEALFSSKEKDKP